MPNFNNFKLISNALFSMAIVSSLSTVVTAEEKPKKTEEKKTAHKVTYDEHILPIFKQHCGSCHNPNDQKGGLTLDNYAAMMQGGGSGDVIESGDPDSSYLVMTVTRESEPYMPPNGKIPEKDINLIKEWIKLGAPQNSGSKIEKKENKIAKVGISLERPSGPPVLPETVSIDPTHYSKRPKTVISMTSSPWAPLVAFAGHKQIFLYDTQNLEFSGVLPFEEGTSHALRFSRNGQLLISGGGRGGASGKVVVWDVKTGQRIAEVGAEYDSVMAADISPDQSKIVLAGPKKMIRVYDVKSGELLYEIKKHTDWITAAEFSPDGVLLVTGDRSSGLFLWEAETGREYLPLNGHKGSITAVSWSPDSNLVASASKDGTIKLWELNDGKVVKTWNAHGNGVTDMSFARDGRIVSTGRDSRVKIWQADGKAIRTLPALSDLGTSVTLNAESDYVFAGDWKGSISVWNAKDGKEVTKIFSNPPKSSDRIAWLEKEVAKYKAADENSRKQLTQLQTAINNRKLAVTNTQKKLDQSKADLQKLVNTSKTLQAELNKVNQSIKTITQKIGTFNKSKADNVKAVQAMEIKQKAEMAKLKKDEEEAQKKLATIQKVESDKAKAKAVQITKDLNTSNVELAAQTVSLKKVQQSISDINKQTTTQKQTIANLTKQLQALQKAAPQTAAESKKISALLVAIKSAKAAYDSTSKKLAFVKAKRNAVTQSASIK